MSKSSGRISFGDIKNARRCWVCGKKSGLVACNIQYGEWYRNKHVPKTIFRNVCRECLRET
jgi:ribosomal protein S14